MHECNVKARSNPSETTGQHHRESLSELCVDIYRMSNIIMGCFGFIEVTEKLWLSLLFACVCVFFYGSSRRVFLFK